MTDANWTEVVHFTSSKPSASILLNQVQYNRLSQFFFQIKQLFFRDFLSKFIHLLFHVCYGFCLKLFAMRNINFWTMNLFYCCSFQHRNSDFHWLTWLDISVVSKLNWLSWNYEAIRKKKVFIDELDAYSLELGAWFEFIETRSQENERFLWWIVVFVSFWPVVANSIRKYFTSGIETALCNRFAHRLWWF